MATYVMVGKYSAPAMQQISADRTTKAKALIQKFGGKLEAAYATLGATTF